MNAINFMPDQTVILAKDSEDHFPLPVIKLVYNDGTPAFISAWVGNWKERLLFLIGKPIYLTILTDKAHPPVLLTTDAAVIGLDDFEKITKEE